MDIIEFYNALENNLSFDDVKGVLELKENEIIWKYNLEMDDGEDEPYYEDSLYYEPTPQAKLFDIFEHDVEIIEGIVDGYLFESDWIIGEPEIDEEEVFFRIHRK